MSYNLAHSIRFARKKITASISQETKIANALVRLASLTGRRRGKKALSSIHIERAVQQHFAREGFENPPNIPWVDVFERPVSRLSRMNNWDREQEDEIILSTLQDILMGRDLAVEGGKQWAYGNMATNIQDLLRQGKSEQDILKILQNQVKRQALIVASRMGLYVRQHGRAKDVPFDPTYSPKDHADGGGQNLILDLLDFDSLSRQQANEFMHIQDTNPLMRDLLRKIDRRIEQKAGWKVKLIWKAMKENPSWTKLVDLGRTEVEYTDPNDGRVKIKPVYEAIGKTRARDVKYEVKKLRNTLGELKSEVKEMIDREQPARR